MAKKFTPQNEELTAQGNDPEINPFQHSDAYPFCADMYCPCHSNKEAVETLHQQYRDGLISDRDAGNIWHRRIV